MAIDPNTFGGTVASQILAARLEELDNKKLTRRVSAFLHHTFKGYAELRSISDDMIFKEMITLWRKDRMSKINFGHGVDSFVGSIVRAFARDWIRGVDSEHEAVHQQG